MTIRRALSAALFALVATTLRAQNVAQSSALAPHQQLARDVYKELIEINTVDGIGSTTVAAEAMAKRFRDAGFPAADVQVFGPRDDKGNLVVRYRGNASGRKPLLLLAHLDVVAALKTDWSNDLDPFKFVERDGYFYGRGTSDDKAMASIFVANLLRMKQEGYVPERDIVLALTADEEGGTANGVQWLLENHRDLINAEYAINEGGGGSLKNGKPFANAVGAAEKVYHDFTLTTHNRGGHSSVPRPDNAIYEMAAALTKVAAYKFPVTLNPVTRAFFERTAMVETGEMAAAMRALAKNPNDAAAQATLAKDPRYNSTMRTTCVATKLAGGHASNALPQTATANVNCRMLPGHDPAQVRAGLVRAIGDTGVEVSAAPEMEHASPSPVNAELMGAVERITKQLWGNIPVIPTMGTGATDSKYLRAAGIPGYGVSGIFGDPNDGRAHGRDERVLVKSYFDGQEFLYRLVKTLGTPSKPVS